jgi:hypothetical protein
VKTLPLHIFPGYGAEGSLAMSARQMNRLELGGMLLAGSPGDFGHLLADEADKGPS